MRIVITGATGLIGSALRARLERDGHEMIAAVRPERDRPLPSGRVFALDFAAATVDDWLPHLAGVEAVVNCVGVLQDGPRDTTAVHSEGAARLFAACSRAGVRRVVQVSAIGVDREGATAFSRSKREGDAALMASDLDWVILRPSVVVGRAAYGGSALIRGLAALPIFPRMPHTGLLQVVQLDDLAETVAILMRPGAPSRLVLEVAGPERLTMEEIVAAYRRWLGGGAQRSVAIASPLAAAAFRVGDLLGWLGWRAPIRTTARREIVRGAVGDNGPWIRATGIKPRSLASALAAEPASVQERWFARLYLLKPLVLGVLVLFWVATGLIALGPGWEGGMSLMREGGIEAIGPAVIVAGALADIAIGLGLAIRRTARRALYAALALSLAYIVIGTVLVPSLWADPLGPMVKIGPILALHLVALAILDDR